MRRLCLVHWDIAEAEKKAPGLKGLGYEVECAAPRGYPGLRPLRDSPPDVVVIDLSRRPAYGRDIAQALRRYKDTRNVPLVLLGGEPAKVTTIRERLPDAVYARWEQAAGALEDAISRTPDVPAVPPSPMEGYSGTPLPRKLGLKPASTVALLGAPDGFEATLGELPDGLVFTRGAGGPCDVVLWFVRSRAELEGEVGRIGAGWEAGGFGLSGPRRRRGWSPTLPNSLCGRLGLALAWSTTRCARSTRRGRGCCSPGAKCRVGLAGPGPALLVEFYEAVDAREGDGLRDQVEGEVV